jgi:hypothetical protein
MHAILLLLILTQDQIFDPDNILRFADHLYTSEDFGAALQEYRRYSFLVDSLPRSTRERLVDCCVQVGRFADALHASDRFCERNYATYAKGYILYKQTLFDSSRIYLEKASAPYREKALVLMGLSFAQQNNFKDAGRFISLPGSLPQHKSVVAGALFSLFPGGGHFYCNRIEDGLFSIAVVGLSSALALYYHSEEEDMKFGISLGAAILLYAGNIYGGINAVRNYNYYIDDAFRNATIESIGTIDPFYR